MIALSAAVAVVGCALAYVLLRLGVAFLAWATAHEERRASDANAKRLDGVDAKLRELDVAVDKLKHENRAAAVAKLGGR